LAFFQISFIWFSGICWFRSKFTYTTLFILRSPLIVFHRAFGGPLRNCMTQRCTTYSIGCSSKLISHLRCFTTPLFRPDPSFELSYCHWGFKWRIDSISAIDDVGLTPIEEIVFHLSDGSDLILNYFLLFRRIMHIFSYSAQDHFCWKHGFVVGGWSSRCTPCFIDWGLENESFYAPFLVVFSFLQVCHSMQ